MSYFYVIGAPIVPGATLDPFIVFSNASNFNGSYPIYDDAERNASEIAMAQDIVNFMGTGSATADFIYDDVNYYITISVTMIVDADIIYPTTYTDNVISNPAINFTSSSTPAPADLTICTECRQSNQQACGETYFIEAGLTSGDTYYAAITDRNNDVYIQAIIADGDGNLTIDALAPEFPVGFWLAESGNKSITVYEDVELTIVSDLTVGANVYTCMILTLQYMYTTTSGLIPDFAFYVSDTLDYYVDNSSNTYIA
jgi:hypothetical protein